MLFHTHFHLAKNTFLGEILAEISSCVTSPASRRGKELVSLLRWTFKKKISPVPFLLFPFRITFYLGFSVPVFTCCLLALLCPSLTDTCEWIEQNYRMATSLYLLQIILLISISHAFYSHTHYLCLCLFFCYLSHACCSLFLCFLFFSFTRCCWDFLLILLVTVCTEKGRH